MTENDHNGVGFKSSDQNCNLHSQSVMYHNFAPCQHCVAQLPACQRNVWMAAQIWFLYCESDAAAILISFIPALHSLFLLVVDRGGRSRLNCEATANESDHKSKARPDHDHEGGQERASMYSKCRGFPKLGILPTKYYSSKNKYCMHCHKKCSKTILSQIYQNHAKYNSDLPSSKVVLGYICPRLHAAASVL